MPTLTVKENTMIISYEENGISKDREATAEEAAYIKSAQAEAAESKKIELDQIAARAKSKAALLAKLGITAEEAALLLS
jgi:hypothetical protein